MATISQTSLRRARLGPLSVAIGRPMFDYYLVLVSTLLLVGLGALMALSSSSVYASAQLGESPYAFAEKQMIVMVIGIPVAWVVSRLSIQQLKWLSWLAMALSAVLLMVVLVAGHSDKGNQAWIMIGGFSVQPSEFAKLSVIVWGATVLNNKQRVLDRPKELMSPLLIGFALMEGLVLAEKDVGTALILAAVMVASLWTVGVPLRLLALLGGVGGLVIGVLVKTSPNRMARIESFLHASSSDSGTSEQPLHAVFALATGGWWGVGLGASRQKWGGLYDGAQNDFVFAVLGEEMGLLGVLITLALLASLGWVGIRIALKSDSLFAKITAAGIAVWIMAQSMVNVAVNMRLLPVIGVPLPFISVGGSALLANLIGVGVLLALARHEPAAQRQLRARSRRSKPRMTTVVDGGH